MMVLDSESIKKARMTITLIALNIACFIATYILSQDDELLIALAQINEKVMDGEIWRLFTSIFVHSNYIHLGGNMIMLLLFGSLIEKTYKFYKYLLIYFISGLIGNLASLVFFPPNTLSLGASGAIFGLVGAALIIVATTNERSLIILALLYVIYFIISSFSPDIDVWAHLFGLLTGLILGAPYYIQQNRLNHSSEI